MKWLRGRKRDVLDEKFLRNLHTRMFGQVWKWAGDYRKTPRNIGVEAWRIPMDVAQAIDDVKFWVANGTYPPDETLPAEALMLRLKGKVVPEPRQKFASVFIPRNSTSYAR